MICEGTLSYGWVGGWLSGCVGQWVGSGQITNYQINLDLIRIFTLKPPYSIAHGKLRLAIWDTSFWTFWLKFGHKGP